MPLMNRESRRFAEAVSRYFAANPFDPETVEIERQALGTDFVATIEVRDITVFQQRGQSRNVRRLDDQAESAAETLRGSLASGAVPADEEWGLYEDLCLHVLYTRFHDDLDPLAKGGWSSAPVAELYTRFREGARYFLAVGGMEFPAMRDLPHLFALFFQLRRAYHSIFTHLAGTSAPMARLRADIWRSVFTHDLKRYRRSLFLRMGDFSTLVTGPSGSGKELVARAIGLSTYVPFDEAGSKFATGNGQSFHPVNLSALSPTLIESELFGHRRGAFTGALEDRKGWLELCGAHGAVFLDEIGELDPIIQVKLLRVLQERTYQRVGDTQTRDFCGKIIAATNRELAAEMRAGTFRADLYYRLCSDVIRTPSLREQLADTSGDLRNLAAFLARRAVGDEETEQVVDEVEDWVDGNLGRDYPWPGNVRELEQCVRSVVIRKEYRPSQPIEEGDGGPVEGFLQSVRQAAISTDELVSRYLSLVYQGTGSYQEAARVTGLDRRTVKAKLDREFLQELAGSEGV